MSFSGLVRGAFTTAASGCRIGGLPREASPSHLVAVPIPRDVAAQRQLALVEDDPVLDGVRVQRRPLAAVEQLDARTLGGLRGDLFDDSPLALDELVGVEVSPARAHRHDRFLAVDEHQPDR